MFRFAVRITPIFTAGNKIGNTAADYHLVVQQSGGDAAFELAKSSFSNEATWDEIMAQLAGSTIQDVILIYFKAPGIITVGLDLIGLKTDVDLGTVTHDLYMQYKYGPEYLRKGEFWDYLTNWEATPNDGVYNPIAYAKVKALRNSDGSVTYYKDNATGMYVFQEIYKTEYDHHLATIQAASDLIGRMAFDVQIENSGGVLKVTMPDGVVYAKGDGTSNTIYGATQNDRLYGMGGNDVLYGNDGDDYLDGGSGSDTLVGGTGSDELVGGSGNDTLIGTNGYGGDDGVSDTLNGGDGFDTYVAGNHDEIYDSDKKGLVVFKNIDLTGTKKRNIDTGVYEDESGFTYQESGNTLIVTAKSGEQLTIQNWDTLSKEGLGIKLGNELIVSISDAAAAEGAGAMHFTVSLSRALGDDEQLTLDVNGTAMVFGTGEQQKTYTRSWSDDDIPESDVAVDVSANVTGFAGDEETVINTDDKGLGITRDDDSYENGVRHDPLVLDTDKDPTLI